MEEVKKNLNKLIIIVSIVCVTIIVIVLLLIFSFKSSGDAEDSLGSEESQGGLLDLLKGMFLGDANESDNGDDSDQDGSEGICGNTCAEGHNQNPYPGCSCYLTDTDGDGVGDNIDAFPNDPDETQDTDGDGVGDNEDFYPNDPDKTEPDCEDSDGGKDVHVRGIMGSGLSDCCTEEGGGVCLLGVSDYVLEYFCNDSDEEEFEVIPCPEGEQCARGICIARAELETDLDTTCQNSLSGGCNGYCDDGKLCIKIDDFGFEYCACMDEPDYCSSYCNGLNSEWYNIGYPAHSDSDCLTGELFNYGCCCEFEGSINQEDRFCYGEPIVGACRDGTGMCNYRAYCSPYTNYITCEFAGGGGFGSGGFGGDLCPTGGGVRIDPGETSMTCSCSFADGTSAETTTPFTVI